MEQLRVSILGCGTMGRAIAEGMLRVGLHPQQLRLSTRSARSAARLASDLGASAVTDNREAAAGADVLVIATKPQKVRPVLAEVLAEHGADAPRPLVVSVAAGVGLADLEAELGPGWPVIRAMPNTPCLLGHGMVVLSAGSSVSEEQLELVRALFDDLGRVRVLTEEHMNTVTGLSGSGPAFVYLIIEALSEGGVMMGLPRDVAVELAAQTVHGAAQMVLSTGRHPASLKDDVTTPGGCTISALLTLEDGKLRSVLARGVQEASRAAAGLG